MRTAPGSPRPSTTTCGIRRHGHALIDIAARLDVPHDEELFGSWVLLVTGGGPTADKPDVVFTAPYDPHRVASQITFRVDDCRGAYELLRSRGAAFLTEPVDHGREVRAFFRDPDGI